LIFSHFFAIIKRLILNILKQKTLKKQGLRFGIALSMILTLVLQNGLVFAQQYNGIDIPIEPLLKTDKPEVQYTENLWEVTDEGVFDENGNRITLPDEENSQEDPRLPADEADESENSFEAYRQSLIYNWGGKKSFAKKRLEGVQENIAQQQSRFQKLEDEIEDTEERLKPIREELTSLQKQIELLNAQIRLTKTKMTNTEVLIAEKQIELKDLILALRRSEIELEIQKKIVLDYVKLLYEEESKYFDLYDEGSSTIKLLLADASVSENLLGQEYFAIMEETGRQVFYDLEEKGNELRVKQEDILRQQADLEFLYEALNKEKLTYEEARLAKKELLEKTQGEEEKYQMLLDQAIQEQLETALAIQNLQENKELIESKLDLLDDSLSEAQIVDSEGDLDELEETMEMIESVDGGSEEEALDEEELKSLKPFAWPVPANKITAEFLDPTYPKKWGNHNAVDIRAKQFTEIRAPASGYVFQTKDNGLGYSYIIIAHKNNLVTVYGHVTEIIAKPGTIVKQGELIGLSGGTPGTRGAGLQTTGPHLHFEVHYKGNPVNPLDYLPLDELPIEYVPDEYLETLK
jgi:murein DD-endopeptidase MepM/ murein hydrolase activator NlpD